MRMFDVVTAAVVAVGGFVAGPAWGATAAKPGTIASCMEQTKAYAEKVAANPDSSSADEWDRLGRECIERGAWAEAIRTYRRGLGYHKGLGDRMANLGVIYAESSRWELAYCLVPKNKEYKKAWERTKRTAKLCAETDKKGFLVVPADLRDR